MEHLEKILNAKRETTRSILFNDCQITLKVDGNAFQSYNDNGTIVFRKRPSNPYQLGEVLTEFDLLFDDAYYNAMKKLQSKSEVLRKYDIVNFEVIGKGESSHLIANENSKVGDLIFLSAFNGKIEDNSPSIALELGVNHVPILYKGKVPEDIIRKMIENKDSGPKVFRIIKDWLSTVMLSHDYSKYIDNQDIEGFVFAFQTNNGTLKTKRYKVVDPSFRQRLMDKLDLEKTARNANKEFIIHDWFYPLQKYWKRSYKGYFDSLLNTVTTISQVSPEFIIKTNRFIYDIIYRKPCIDFLKENGYDATIKEVLFKGEEFMKTLFFVMLTFKRERLKGFWVTPEFQQEILNDFVKSLHELN